MCVLQCGLSLAADRPSRGDQDVFVGEGDLTEALHMVAGDAVCISESTIQVTMFLTSSVLASTDGSNEGFSRLLMEKISACEQITV